MIEGLVGQLIKIAMSFEVVPSTAIVHTTTDKIYSNPGTELGVKFY